MLVAQPGVEVAFGEEDRIAWMISDQVDLGLQPQTGAMNIRMNWGKAN